LATTQTVTVMFTDLVGFTELSSRLGPEATDALRQTHFGLLRGAIQSAGGIEVKNLGDGAHGRFHQPESGTGVRGGHAAGNRSSSGWPKTTGRGADELVVNAVSLPSVPVGLTDNEKHQRSPAYIR
jgi:class 3 adenylate cyclase